MPNPEPQITPRSTFFANVVPAVIAGAIVLYFGVSLFLPFFVDKAPTDPAYSRGLSTLENVLLLVVGFYFGSNATSMRKTELLATKPPLVEVAEEPKK